MGRQHYVPCLRWKQGEYQALMRLSPVARESTMPLIEVPEIGYDFETRRSHKSIDEHLSPFARRVKEKWGRDECFVDMRLVAVSDQMANGQHPVAFVFDELRVQGVLAIPVIGVEPDSNWRAACRKVVSEDGRGLCLRIGIESVAEPTLGTAIQSLLRRCDVGIGDCDVIVDLAAPNFEPIEGFVDLLETLIRNMPFLERWRSFGLIGTSFPASMADLGLGASIIPRNEWRLYKLLLARLSASGTRIPDFGDYAINHPDVPEVDMRLVKPYASVRYTIEDSWLVARGQNVRDHGFGQYRELCRAIVKSREYSGKAFSEGDRYIHDCAQGAAPTGNLTTWRWVGTNHHVEKVARDVAKLAAP